MLSRAQYFLKLEAELYLLDRLAELGEHLVREQRERRRELAHEKRDLENKMGGSDRRELARLRAAQKDQS